MVLEFNTHFNGKPTHFVEKIWAGLESRFAQITRKGKIYLMPQEYFNCLDLGFENMKPFKPKIHTLRNDVDDVWQRGVPIEFVVNDENRNAFQFAPVLPVVNVQEVFMTYAHSDLIQISIDGRELFSYSERLEFALNDGFDSWEDFFKFFYPKIMSSPKRCYKPKLIHWTNLKY